MFETKTKTKTKTKGLAGDDEGIGAMDGTEVDVKTKSTDVDSLLKESQQALKVKPAPAPVRSSCGCW